jgi:hypothetical protein
MKFSKLILVSLSLPLAVSAVPTFNARAVSEPDFEDINVTPVTGLFYTILEDSWLRST